jgi:hypothetical protein
MTDNDYTDDQTCPHCGKRITDIWEIGRGEEGKFETDCGWCSKPIKVSRSISVSYQIFKGEGR